MNKVKLCVVTTTSITIRSFLLQQLEFLTNNGFDVTVICDEDEELRRELPKGIQYRSIRMKRGLDPFGALKNSYFLYRAFKEEKFDIVQYSTPNAALYASIASYMAKIPVRLYCQWGIRYVGFKGIRRKLFKIVEKMICSLSTSIQPDSLGNLTFSRQENLYTAEKSKVIGNGSANGVNLIRFDFSKRECWSGEIRRKYNLLEDEIIFGFTGRITKDKGINELLEAFQVICKEFNNVKLLIVGPSENYGINSSLYDWSQQSHSVIYCGYTDQVERYYAAMDVFVLPSYREGFGTVVIEAEAMGIPVIVSDIPGPTDAMVEGQTGMVVPKGEVEPLIEAMKKMLDTSLRKEMGNRAITFVSESFEQKTHWQHILNDRKQLVAELENDKREVSL
ncbi:glycosyltransferase family 4 protein [Alkalihalobacterium chitinilyticum]|uniref:Glycosyltransferase family 4 protein n=1 Tax=Alkalihalobacterium chitinilyticum TaxID=2980103 RepID=A0ABT5VHU3_9BACI|nr:glycosyltransferase family 4 protein [Alkalihalobacterium chitinilyticum]MDE5413804.1 glycosyltransferase family 4 protein [Alkalihalobacterium chitinilyticum]